ncbi:glycosyltransferase family 2 protein [Sphingobacterium gobiense]|uniref:Glycosyltransferase 2-like domain-containing protein n=1 Tax=Sphingobacterium gobiense TaxID=1382456 RepID=A0A2S9JMR1_9SPHI|nr:glycosyltransferase [Sphingobacterium gobiense]PRD54424.1 hypothetical protein C5749_13260 [Sphingobacterium gobiense]
MEERDLSLIVGLRNNLDYTKAFYASVRQLYPEVEIVFVSYGSSDNTHEWLDGLLDPFVKYFYSEKSKTLSDTYNTGVLLASGKLVAFLHNDMIMGKGFVEQLIDAWKPGQLLFYTVVEPPIFAEDKHDWKVVIDFGTDLETFRTEEFCQYNKGRQAEANLKPFITEDASFFLCVEREWLLEMGGMDPLYNPMFCEDSDLLIRFKLQNATMFQVPKAIVYHFVSKTSRFSREYQDRTKRIEENAIRNFYRKWRFAPSSSLHKRYDIAAIVYHADLSNLRKIEPYFAKIYIDADGNGYIADEQQNTAFDLTSRFAHIDQIESHDVLVSFDMNKLDEKDFKNLLWLPEILHRHFYQSTSLIEKLFFNRKRFKKGNLHFQIENLKASEEELIVRNLN